MTVTTTDRLGITRWDSGTDEFNRLQMDGSHSSLEALAAGFLIGASLPSFNAANHEGFLHYNTSTGVLSFGSSTAWETVTNVNTNDGEVSAIVPGDVSSAGTGNAVALANHVHAVDPYGSVGSMTAITGSAGAGVTDEFARIDHTHALSQLNNTLTTLNAVSPELRIQDTQTVLADGSIAGSIEFHTSDTDGGGNNAYIRAIAAGAKGALDMRFGLGTDAAPGVPADLLFLEYPSSGDPRLGLGAAPTYSLDVQTTNAVTRLSGTASAQMLMTSGGDATASLDTTGTGYSAYLLSTSDGNANGWAMSEGSITADTLVFSEGNLAASLMALDTSGNLTIAGSLTVSGSTTLTSLVDDKADMSASSTSGRKLTVSATAPVSNTQGDLWVDIS